MIEFIMDERPSLNASPRARTLLDKPEVAALEILRKHETAFHVDFTKS